MANLCRSETSFASKASFVIFRDYCRQDLGISGKRKVQSPYFYPEFVTLIRVIGHKICAKPIFCALLSALKSRIQALVSVGGCYLNP
jgi:hypothetical protein